MNWNVICWDRSDVYVRFKNLTTNKHQTVRKKIDVSNARSSPCTCWSHSGRRLAEPSWAGAACEWVPQESGAHLTLGSAPHRSCSSEWLSAGGALLESPERGMFYGQDRKQSSLCVHFKMWPWLLSGAENWQQWCGLWRNRTWVIDSS